MRNAREKGREDVAAWVHELIMELDRGNKEGQAGDQTENTSCFNERKGGK